ncbi:kinase-like domain-containing protein [Linnemannia elongata]|nr:kinase-like domain-containing protein [Linnemannia elongata]
MAFEEGLTLPSIQIGKRVYQCFEKLGRGGHGTVFRANSGSQQYAMKVCLCEPDQPWRKLMYKTEADILKSLDHPNVVKYIDDLQFGDMTILVMEQCQGGSLETLLEDAWESNHIRKLSEEHVAPLMAGVVQALHYLHTIGLVHHDIKLGNILLDDNGNAKVADFGMSYYEQLGRKIGTNVATAYHAPEMAGKHALSSAIDAYAFGAILYRLLVGKEYNRQDWPDMDTEGVGELARKVIISALDPSPITRATLRELLRYEFFEKYISKEKRSLEGSDLASDTPSKRVAQGLEGTSSSSPASIPASADDDWWLEDDTEDEEDNDESELSTSGEDDDALGDDTNNVNDDNVKVEVAQNVEDAQAEKDGKAKEALKSPVDAEAGEESAKDNHDTAKANVAEDKSDDKEKRSLCVAPSSSDTDDDASELANQPPLPDAAA